MTESLTHASTGTRGPLAQALVALAGTPDDVPDIGERLDRVAQLAADRIGGIHYAAVATRHDDDCCTVATGGDLEQAITGVPAGATTMAWPGFRETAAAMGLGMVSVPLFTGSGAAPASLDLYGRDATAMAPLAAGICAANDPALEWPAESGTGLGSGAGELVAGFAEALSVRAGIQLALAMLGGDPGTAYLTLRLRAADRDLSLPDAADAVIMQGFG
ncbi:MAG TPA: hypothetical protein VN408_29005 [Actinoplanes sp.]|nr:hypothetical protein [Actinoplanes sp.]